MAPAAGRPAVLAPCSRVPTPRADEGCCLRLLVRGLPLIVDDPEPSICHQSSSDSLACKTDYNNIDSVVSANPEGGAYRIHRLPALQADELQLQHAKSCECDMPNRLVHLTPSSGMTARCHPSVGLGAQRVRISPP